MHLLVHDPAYSYRGEVFTSIFVTPIPLIYVEMNGAHASSINVDKGSSRFIELRPYGQKQDGGEPEDWLHFPEAAMSRRKKGATPTPAQATLPVIRDVPRKGGRSSRSHQPSNIGDRHQIPVML